MLTNDILQVHAEELVTRKDYVKIAFTVPLEVVHILANRIGRALIPIVALISLFSGKNIDKSTCIRIELVGFLDVSVKRSGIKLRENEDLVKARIEAVADRYID